MVDFSRRQLVRLASFALAAVVVLIGFCAVTQNQRKSTQQLLEYGYLRGLQDATDLVGRVSVDMEKALYAATPAYFSALATGLSRDAAAAKSALFQLPMWGMDLSGATRFLSQAGDYTASLSKKAVAGSPITETERETLATLITYARTLHTELVQIERRFATGEVTLEELQSELTSRLKGAPPENAELSGSGFASVEKAFGDYPTLIYDGPFSDHLLNRAPAMTAGKDEISKEAARLLAAAAAGHREEELKDLGEEQSKMPAYLFGREDMSLAVAKNGGYLVYLRDAREVNGTAISLDAARQAARDYLKKLGLRTLRETYYETNANMMLINFAHVQDEVVCYTDLVKVGVALDNGQITLVDTRGYLVNHKSRTIPLPAISAARAQEKLPKNLKLRQHRMALIPTAGGSEALCYEFDCEEPGGGELLVYINAQTGEQENSLKVLRHPGGVLVK